MPFTFEFSREPKYLKITLKGVMDNVAETLAFMSAAGKYSDEIGQMHILIDEREMIHNFSKK